jgi:hypothetical protein
VYEVMVDEDGKVLHACVVISSTCMEMICCSLNACFTHLTVIHSLMVA